MRVFGREDLFSIHADDVLVRIFEAETGLTDDGAIDGHGAAGDDSGAVAAGGEAEACEDALQAGRFADGVGLLDKRGKTHGFEALKAAG